MLQEHVVDLRGCDFFSTSIDQFLDAPRQSKVAVVIEDTGVLGAKPSIYESRGRCLRVIAVTAHDVGPPHDYFSGMIRRQVPARLIDDRELDSSAEPDRARLVWTRRQRIGGDLVSCLGQPICFQNGCSKTFL